MWERTLIPLRILGIPLLLMGLCLGAYGLFTLATDVFGSVAETEAVVEARRTEQRRVTASRGGGYDVTVVLMRFGYVAQGKRHSVEREVPRNTDIGRAQVGDRVQVFYREHDPSDVLVQRPSATHGLALLMGSAFLCAFGLMGTVALLFRKR